LAPTLRPPGATELSEMFRQMGKPITPDKLVEIFMKVGRGR
jgi:hypothetical protein